MVHSTTLGQTPCACQIVVLFSACSSSPPSWLRIGVGEGLPDHLRSDMDHHDHHNFLDSGEPRPRRAIKGLDGGMKETRCTVKHKPENDAVCSGNRCLL